MLFCDLVESTALAGQLDPEDYRALVRAYQDACATVIQRFDGHIAQYLGDGLLVYFGYPQAHEDDAQRAVRAGLALVAAMAPLKSRLARDTGIRLAVRVGIHTGLVVVGEMGSGGRHERLALGDTPNLAARLQGLAEPDTVVISAATWRLVEGYVRCKDAGPAVAQGDGHAGAGVSGAGRGSGPESPGGGGAPWLDAPGGAGGRSGAAAGALGAGHRRAGAGRGAQRRGGHWQIPPGAGAQRARGGGLAYPARVPGLALSPAQRPVSRHRALATGSGNWPQGKPRRSTYGS